jgi:hypothetical protein
MLRSVYARGHRQHRTQMAGARTVAGLRAVPLVHGGASGAGTRTGLTGRVIGNKRERTLEERDPCERHPA